MGDMRMYGYNGDYNDWAEDFDFFLKAKGLDSKTGDRKVSWSIYSLWRS